MSNGSTFSCRWKLIWRYGLRRTINYFAISAVFLSIACLFTVNAVMKGFDQQMQDLLRGSLSDIIVDFSWDVPKLNQLEKNFSDYKWSAPLNHLGVIKLNGYIEGIKITGVDPKRESELRSSHENSIPFQLLDEKVTKNSDPLGGLLGLFGEESSESIENLLIGEALADYYGVQKGDQVTLVIPNWMGSASDHQFRVKAVYKSGYLDEEWSKVFIPRAVLEKILQHPNGYSNVQINYKEGQSYTQVKSDVLKMFPTANISTWRDRHAVKLRAIVNERKLIALVLSMIVIVASFGILAIQWSFVQEKTRDIGLLRAMGFRNIDIFSIFLGVSWIVGVLGLVFGLMGGVALSTYANDLIELTGWQPFPDGIYYMSEGLPFVIEVDDMIWISALSLAVTTLAGFLPAFRAVKVEPIKAISYE